MKVFEYDICDSDKGIIFAETYERAVEMFVKDYPDCDPECYDYTDVENNEKYRYGAMINEVCDYDGREKLVFIVG